MNLTGKVIYRLTDFSANKKKKQDCISTKVEVRYNNQKENVRLLYEKQIKVNRFMSQPNRHKYSLDSLDLVQLSDAAQLKM